MPQDMRHKLRGGIALNIQFGGNNSFQGRNITVPGMALIRPGMNGYPLCAERLTIPGYLDQVRQVPTPAVADQGNLIDIDTQAYGMIRHDGSFFEEEGDHLHGIPILHKCMV